MIKRIFIYTLVLIASTITLTSCKAKASLNGSTPTVNSKTAMNKPYLILVSLDGFRWDYVDKYNPPHLSDFIAQGVKAEALVPTFPSKTFPNHYSIATGMYPDKHGLLGNSFYSYKKDLTYKIRNREMVEDGSFYGGSPIWVQADKASMVSASYFFVGSEADVQGIRPTYYHRYDGKIKNEARIAQALQWLSIKKKNRPHMITMYFSDMDDVGHDFGPNNDKKLKNRLFKLDRQLGSLLKGIEETGLPVNIIIVSDHGMASQSTENLIAINDVYNDNLYTLINNGALVNIHPKKNVPIDSVFSFLKKKERHFKVYKTSNAPGFEYTPKNKDWGTLQLIPDKGHYFVSATRIEALKKSKIRTTGVHGFDPKYQDMHGIFYAKGPAFKEGFTVPAVKNIHVYPILCKILGLQVPDDIDGKIEELESILKNGN